VAKLPGMWSGLSSEALGAEAIATGPVLGLQELGSARQGEPESPFGGSIRGAQARPRGGTRSSRQRLPGMANLWRSGRPSLKLLFALLAALGVALPLTAQEAAPPAAPVQRAEPPEGPKQPVTIIPAASDAQIAARLQSIMQATGWFRQTLVSVRDGVVFIDAKTERAEHRRWAGSLAENTQGTVAVVNRIEIVSDVGSTFDRAAAELADLYRRALRAWPVVLLGTVIVLITGLIAKLVAVLARWFFASRVPSPLLLTVIARTISIPILLLGVYFMLQVAGLTRLALTVLGGTGIIGIILGFAFRDIAENFLASLLLSIRNPFRYGDLIEVGGHTGIVRNLNTRSTVLLSLDGSHVQIPNATVYKSTIRNFSSTPNRRAEFMVGIGYDSSIARAQAIITEVLGQHPAVLPSPEPLVLVDQLDAATVNLKVSYWFESATYSPAKINSALLRLSKNALIRAGIELPDSAREVVFPKGISMTLLEPSNRPSEPAIRTSADSAAGANEVSDVTSGEGDLSNESVKVREQAGNVPEARENLLSPDQ
jgi:small conductance mechanosensitive channel